MLTLRSYILEGFLEKHPRYVKAKVIIPLEGRWVGQALKNFANCVKWITFVS